MSNTDGKEKPKDLVGGFNEMENVWNKYSDN